MTELVSSSFGDALRKRQAFARTMRLCLAASVLFISLGLWRWGAVEVRGHFDQVLLLTLLGLAWLFALVHLFSWLGISVSDDILERRNPAALAALCGATLGVALIYLCGGLGEGPSYWNNVFSVALGTFGFFLLWFLLELWGGVSRSIAEERDLASGIRLCGFLLGIGLILGRAVAGDWHSESATVHDFLRDGWPGAVLCLLAAIVEWFVHPSRKRPVGPWPSHGMAPALAYIALASAWLYHLGRWEGMPV